MADGALGVETLCFDLPGLSMKLLSTGYGRSFAYSREDGDEDGGRGTREGGGGQRSPRRRRRRGRRRRCRRGGWA